jgi:predicted ATPase
LGREFSYRLLRAVCPLSEALLQADLARLVEAELLYQHGVPPDARFMFKHALLQEETYESLLRSKRQQVHQRIATVLESEFAEVGSTQPELIAHHYTNAMRHLAAIPYWQRAGQSAMERSANVEAVAHLSKGLECLTQVAETPQRRQLELALQISLAVALMATRGWAAPEVGRAAARARELSGLVGDSPQLLPVLWGLWVFSVVRADFSASEALAMQFRRIANSANIADQTSRLQEHFMAGDALFWQGRFESARRELEQGDALENAFVRREQANTVGWDCGVSCLMHASWSTWILGYPDRAAGLNRDMLKLAAEISHPSTTLWSLWGAGVLHQLRREVQPAMSSADAMIQLATELVFPHWAGLGTALKGWALGSLGAAEQGMPMTRKGMNTWRATAGETITCFCLSMLAELQIAHGCAKEGIDGLDEMISSIQRTNERWLETELYRLKGEALLAQSPDRGSEAEACFQHAIEVAREQAAKSFELRAAVSLARFWRQKRRGEASRMLSSIYAWFKEGFETTDLRSARALLEDLG